MGIKTSGSSYVGCEVEGDVSNFEVVVLVACSRRQARGEGAANRGHIVSSRIDEFRAGRHAGEVYGWLKVRESRDYTNNPATEVGALSVTVVITRLY